MQIQTENPTTPILRIHDLHVHFPIREGLLIQHHATVKAVNGLGFQLNRGDVFGLVGESGCGKTTLGRAVVGVLSLAPG
jgi:ABC-type oligopeptide transport system ATPase subunit